MFLDKNPKRKRRFGEDNIVRTQDGEVMILPSYDPDNSYPFYQSEYFPLREDSFDYYNSTSGQIVLMDGTVSGDEVVSEESKSSQAFSQGMITQPEIDWITSYSKWIILGLIGIGALFMLRRRPGRSAIEEEAEEEVGEGVEEGVEESGALGG
jgi:hypothetical protein